MSLCVASSIFASGGSTAGTDFLESHVGGPAVFQEFSGLCWK